LHKHQKIIFVGGSPRSGTTLFQKILDLHTDIYAGPEFDHLPQLMHLYIKMKEGITTGRQQMYYDSKRLKESTIKFIKTLLVEKFVNKGHLIISEKTPDNVLVFNELIELFPDAKFIIIVRDPRGVFNSFKRLKKKDLRANKKRRIGFGDFFYEDLKKIYKSIYLGNKFLEKHNSCCHLVFYEHLVTSPKQEIKKVCNFLDISYQPQMLNTERRNDSTILIEKMGKEKNPFVTPLFDQKIQKSSLNSWKKELSNIEINTINYFFSKKKISCLSNYNFSHSPILGKTFLFIKQITYLFGILIIKIQTYKLIHTLTLKK